MIRNVPNYDVVQIQNGPKKKKKYRLYCVGLKKYGNGMDNFCFFFFGNVPMMLTPKLIADRNTFV